MIPAGLLFLVFFAGLIAGLMICLAVPRAMARWRAWRAYQRKLMLARGRRARWRLRGPASMPAPLRAIVDEECAAAGVHLEELIGPHKRRCKRVTAVRWAVLGRAWRELRPHRPDVYTLTSISAALHVDHSSAHYALNKMGEKGEGGEKGVPGRSPAPSCAGAEPRLRRGERPTGRPQRSEDRPSGREGERAT